MQDVLKFKDISGAKGLINLRVVFDSSYLQSTKKKKKKAEQLTETNL